MESLEISNVTSFASDLRASAMTNTCADSTRWVTFWEAVGHQGSKCHIWDAYWILKGEKLYSGHRIGVKRRSIIFFHLSISHDVGVGRVVLVRNVLRVSIRFC